MFPDLPELPQLDHSWICQMKQMHTLQKKHITGQTGGVDLVNSVRAAQLT